ncbi:MAG: GAF domain-containing protein [Candidatus Izemoplasmatales bacterium]|jgi:GAF domain-containing protein
MFTNSQLSKNQASNYDLLLDNLKGYLDKDVPIISNLANMSAIIRYFFDDINWAGFYLAKDDHLLLGPFQGLPACTQIPMGKGVCGIAAKNQKPLIINDVADFPDHIVCDSNSRSEIVIPIIKNNTLFGVLDLDSPYLARFGETERLILEKAVALLVDIL